ncbi:glycosyltransferase family 2 protein [Carboxylicivirga sp. M1479]|uniref:glycosyltransferase family 2 protein n=1 Tax=Carboxylicivirga sp. M1479 TaxID=2594476 RepID=UPI00117849F3|nr:glycosyltransferase family 2 protein [Carboxylicivirga sp. M1479]TRX70280.1 glycosyltransferase [Carboxylicivirga sp. M1479]
MQPEKKITIITVTFNSAQTLIETINSVWEQTARKNIEYIIIDGLSTDNTIDVLKNNEDKVDQWISEADKGIYDAMNKGLNMAKGDWVGFLHADDMFASKEIIEKMLMTEEEYNTMYGNLNYIQTTPPYKIIRFWQSQKFSKSLLKRGWMPPHPTVYIKKDHINKIGKFDTTFKISADYDYMLRLFSDKETQSYYLNDTIVNMRIGGVSNNSIKNILQKTKEDYKALSKNRVGGFLALFIKNFSKLIQFVKK